VHQRYLLTEKNSSFLMSVPYTVAAIACPVFGALVDKTGRLQYVYSCTTDTVPNLLLTPGQDGQVSICTLVLLIQYLIYY
jgi:MFS family permease